MARKAQSPISSNNRSAVTAMVAACSALGATRLVIVGGSPASRRQFRELAGQAVRIRFIDGLERLTRRDAAALARWADVIVIWASTQLEHRVSRLVKKNPESRGKIVLASRRGIASVAGEVVRHIHLRSNRTGRRTQ